MDGNYILLYYNKMENIILSDEYNIIIYSFFRLNFLMMDDVSPANISEICQFNNEEHI